ncbi:MAG TPA: NDP-sugar synthase [Acidimicrobiales bacterium]|nr:NDP-sugar synthase [Acidimicrobiales bacterium]
MLVGGFGTRLRPLTLSTPKQMLPVAGRPMIERVLAHLASHGIDEVVLSLGYRPDAFMGAYPDATCAGVRLRYAVEPEPLDTAGAIRFAATEAGIDERFLVVNGDVLTDLDLGALIDFHDAAGAEGTIALTKVDDPSQFGVVPTDDDGRVEAFVEKPPPGEAPTDLINAGFYVLEASVLGRIAPGVRVNIERETFPAMVADGTLFARPDEAYWLDVGTPERYLAASLDLLDGRRVEQLEASDADLVAGEVILPAALGDGVRIAEGASVARSVLGDGARVEPGARVTGSVLLPAAVIGRNAVVTDSVVGLGAVVGEEATVEGVSVLGDAAFVEAGEHLDGARRPDADEA